MKRELRALLFLLLPTKGSIESFIKLTSEDDLENALQNNPTLDKEYYLSPSKRKTRNSEVRQNFQTRRKEICRHFLYSLLVVVVAVLILPKVSVEIKSKQLLQLFGVVLLIWSQAFKIKSSEKTFCGDDLFERTLNLSETLLFWAGIILTLVLLLY